MLLLYPSLSSSHCLSVSFAPSFPLSVSHCLALVFLCLSVSLLHTHTLSLYGNTNVRHKISTV